MPLQRWQFQQAATLTRRRRVPKRRLRQPPERGERDVRAAACVRMRRACCDSAASSAAAAAAAHMAEGVFARGGARFKAKFTAALDAQSAALVPHAASIRMVVCFFRRAMQLSKSVALKAAIGCKLVQLLGVRMQLNTTTGDLGWQPCPSYDSGQPIHIEGVMWRLASIHRAGVHAKRVRFELKTQHAKRADAHTTNLYSTSRNVG